VLQAFYNNWALCLQLGCSTAADAAASCCTPCDSVLGINLAVFLLNVYVDTCINCIAVLVRCAAAVTRYMQFAGNATNM
jgi:hypothetical protein